MKKQIAGLLITVSLLLLHSPDAAAAEKITSLTVFSRFPLYFQRHSETLEIIMHREAVRLTLAGMTAYERDSYQYRICISFLVRLRYVSDTKQDF